jgi:hypothetical protein
VNRKIALLLVGNLGWFATAQATTLLQHEPSPGHLPAGTSVLVDNGKCPGGQVQEVTGGGNRHLRSGLKNVGSKREYKCAPRPKV